ILIFSCAKATPASNVKNSTAMIPIILFICFLLFGWHYATYYPAQRVEPHDGQKRTLCERTLRRMVLDVNKFLPQLRDRMIGRSRAGNGRLLMIPSLNP
ncbi:MAG: hypothetical protein ABIJ25_06845, partial [Pseudomonadota bacterium]